MPTVTVYTREEVAKHNQPGDAWIIIDNFVYDISKFAKLHPGGNQILMDYAGTHFQLCNSFDGFHGFNITRTRRQ